MRTMERICIGQWAWTCWCSSTALQRDGCHGEQPQSCPPHTCRSHTPQELCPEVSCSFFLLLAESPPWHLRLPDTLRFQSVCHHFTAATHQSFLGFQMTLTELLQCLCDFLPLQEAPQQSECEAQESLGRNFSVGFRSSSVNIWAGNATRSFLQRSKV